MLANYVPSIFKEGKVSYEQIPLSYQKVNIETPIESSLSIVTSAQGRWSAHLPLEGQINLSLINQCDEPMNYSEDFSSSETSILTELDDSVIDNLLPLNFRNVDCEGNNLSNPAMYMDFGQQSEVFLFAEDKIETVFAVCGDVKIASLNLENNMRGPEIPWNQSIEDELGILPSCIEGGLGYSYLKLNGEEEILPTFTYSINDGELFLNSQDNTIRIKIRGNQVGAYSEDQVNIFIENEAFGNDGYYINCENSSIGCGINDCYISHFEEMEDGLFRMTFSGVLWMQTINNPTAGNYEVEGQILIRQ